MKNILYIISLFLVSFSMSAQVITEGENYIKLDYPGGGQCYIQGCFDFYAYPNRVVVSTPNGNYAIKPEHGFPGLTTPEEILAYVDALKSEFCDSGGGSGSGDCECSAEDCTCEDTNTQNTVIAGDGISVTPTTLLDGTISYTIAVDCSTFNCPGGGGGSISPEISTTSGEDFYSNPFEPGDPILVIGNDTVCLPDKNALGGGDGGSYTIVYNDDFTWNLQDEDGNDVGDTIEDTFADPQAATEDGTDAFGNTYVTGDNIIVYPNGDVVCVPPKGVGEIGAVNDSTLYHINSQGDSTFVVIGCCGGSNVDLGGLTLVEDSLITHISSSGVSTEINSCDLPITHKVLEESDTGQAPMSDGTQAEQKVLLLGRDKMLSNGGSEDGGSVIGRITSSFADATPNNSGLQAPVTTYDNEVTIGSRGSTLQGQEVTNIASRDNSNTGNWTMTSGRQNSSDEQYSFMTGRGNGGLTGTHRTGNWNIAGGASNQGDNVRTSIDSGINNDYVDMSGSLSVGNGNTRSQFEFSLGAGESNVETDAFNSLFLGNGNNRINVRSGIYSGNLNIADGQGIDQIGSLQSGQLNQLFGSVSGTAQFGSNNVWTGSRNGLQAGTFLDMPIGCDNCAVIGMDIQVDIPEKASTYMNFLHLVGDDNTNGNIVPASAKPGPKVLNAATDLLTVDPADAWEVKRISTADLGIPSLRSLKENIISAQDYTDWLNEIDVYEYNYIGDDTKHIGVMADDFSKLGFGANGDKVGVGDAIGLLYKLVKSQQIEIEELKAKLK